MIGKLTKGTSFGGCVRYVLKEERQDFWKLSEWKVHRNR